MASGHHLPAQRERDGEIGPAGYYGAGVWRLTQLTQPPAEWRACDFAIGQLRQDHPRARLIPPTWVAAVIARLKDEEVLTKRRQTRRRGEAPQGERTRRQAQTEASEK